MIGTYIIIGIVVLLVLLGLFVVRQQTSAVVERFGKFHSIRGAGLQLKIPVIDRISGRVSLRIQKIDVIVENKIIIEVKAVERVLPVHEAQLLSYMKLTKISIGLLLNFKEAILKNGIIRRVI